ncbi:MAG TPA: CPBP family glutamic-type intramembrane protease [Gemmatimonadales bacterium]|nr:CPBP family glutamic-type intramembrane protease [Gemmatimonadales bacterium]
MPDLRAYWRLSRAPRYSLLFVFPLLLLYEILAFALSHDAIAGVRNGADVLLKSLFISLGGRDGLIVFGVLLVGSGAWLVWRDWRRTGGRLRWSVFGLMLVESVVYALVFGFVVGSFTALLMGWLPRLAIGALAQFSLPTQLMISLGAGIYEELLFRVLLVSGLALMARRLFGWNTTAAGVFATLVGALIFSGFHYIGPYGDQFTAGSFVFRAIAGVLFSALYLLRGFGITAWTHALYDVWLTLLT